MGAGTLNDLLLWVLLWPCGDRPAERYNARLRNQFKEMFKSNTKCVKSHFYVDILVFSELSDKKCFAPQCENNTSDNLALKLQSSSWGLKNDSRIVICEGV